MDTVVVGDLVKSPALEDLQCSMSPHVTEIVWCGCDMSRGAQVGGVGQRGARSCGVDGQRAPPVGDQRRNMRVRTRGMDE